MSFQARVMERTGVVEEGVDRREKYGRFAYVAPHDRLLRDPPLETRPKKPRVKPVSNAALWASVAPNPRAVFEAVTSAYDITLGELLGYSRERRVTYPRFAAARLLHVRLKMSTAQVARSLGKRDHSTASDAIRRAAAFLANDPEWAARYHAAERILDGVK